MTSSVASALLRHHPQAAAWLKEGRVTDANDAWREQMGPGDDPAASVAADDHGVLRAALASPEAAALEVMLRDGAAVTLSLGPTLSELGRPCSVAPPPTDADRLDALQHLNDALLDRVDAALYIKDLEGRYQYMNAGGAHMLGLSAEQVCGSTDVDLFGAEVAAQIAKIDGEVLASRQTVTHQPTRLVDDASRTFLTTKHPYIDATGQVAGVIGVSHDLTAWLRAREAAERQARLDAVGRLASGLAHQLDGPVTRLMDHLAQTRSAPPAEISAPLDAACEAAEAIDGVVRAVLGAEHRDGDASATCDPAQVIARVVSLAEARLPAGATLSVQTTPRLRVACQPERLQHILLQLVDHAIDRLSATTGPRALTVRADERDGEAHIEVQDSGPTPARAELDHLFEPYRSAPGAGRLLGLWMAWRSAAAAGVVLERVPMNGDGCCLRVRAPAVPSGHQDAAASTERLRVLIIDDDPSLLELLAEALSSAADVETAASGRAGLAWLRAHPAPDVVLCDLMMDDLNGVALHERLAGLDHPAADRMVFMTGGAFTAETRAFVASHSGRVLQKPFRLSALMDRVLRWAGALSDRDG
jgi:PAS domain S-box-containing protein